MKQRAVGIEAARWAALIAVLVAAAGTPSRLPAEALREITNVKEARSLPEERARLALPVRVRGVVTVVSGWKASFFLQDKTAGISVDRNLNDPPLHRGQQVELEGVTGPGMFAPIIMARKVTVLGEGRLPAARLATLEELAGGKEDSQWLAMRGIVRSAIVKPSWGRPVLFLELDIGGGELASIHVQRFTAAAMRSLPGSKIAVRGVCATNFNDKREFLGLRLFVSTLEDVRVLRPGPSDPFDHPLRPLDRLAQFDPGGSDIDAVRVRGTATYAQPGQGLYLEAEGRGIAVQGPSLGAGAVGATVEAVGYPGTGSYSSSLESAIARVIDAAGRPAPPLTAPAGKMIAENEGFRTAPYDSRLVRLRGLLVQHVPNQEEEVLFLRDGNTAFTARLPRSAMAGNLPAAGSLLEATGVCVALVDRLGEVRGFKILLRSASDIAVVRGAPWWNAAHATQVAAALLAAMTLLAAWQALMRWQAGLRELALTDPLTGLYNRRGFLLLAEHQRELALRKRAPVLLFYIDVNDFKEINDSFGHKEGDLALQAVAAALRECFRKTDLIGRMGGDEFAVAAVDALPGSGALLEARLGMIVERNNQRSRRAFPLSLSVGVAACEQSLELSSVEDLLERADARMYERKRSGKRCGLRASGVAGGLAIEHAVSGNFLVEAGSLPSPLANPGG